MASIGSAVAVILLVLTATAARAHTALVSSEPAAGAEIAALPSQVTLRFSDPVQLEGSSIALVVGAARTELTGLRIDSTATTLTADVPPGTVASGPATFTWQAVADDGHVAQGDIGVGVGGAAAPATTTSETDGDPDLVRSLFTADRLAAYLSLATLCGGLLFLVVVWPDGADVRRARRLLWLAAAIGALTAIGGVLLQAATLAGGDLAAVHDGAALRAVLATAFGRAWASRVLLFGLAVPLLVALGVRGSTVIRQPWFVVSASAVGIGLLRTPGFVAHSSEGDMGVVGSIADLAHLVGVAAWIGGLVMLVAVVLPRRRAAELAVVVPRFSRLALGAVSVIVVAGVVMTWDIAGSIHLLTTTQWGRLLLTKLVIFLGLLAAALVSRRWVAQRLRIAVVLRGHASVVRAFLVSVATEAVLAAIVVSIASLLVATSPGR